MADSVLPGVRPYPIKDVLNRVGLAKEVRIRDALPRPLAPHAPAPPADTAPATPSTSAGPSLPSAPATNPFAALPFRSPGDRIKSEDFNSLARGLQIIGDAYILTSALFGVSFGQARLMLASQQYEIERVLSVFGAEISTRDDASLDGRKVIQVAPSVLGERRVLIVVTEAVENRRLAPNLIGLSYAEALERQRGAFAEGTFPAVSVNAAPLVGHSLREAPQIVNQ